MNASETHVQRTQLVQYFHVKRNSALDVRKAMFESAKLGANPIVVRLLSTGTEVTVSIYRGNGTNLSNKMCGGFARQKKVSTKKMISYGRTNNKCWYRKGPLGIENEKYVVVENGLQPGKLYASKACLVFQRPYRDLLKSNDLGET